jgi:hypothetical protein
VTDPDPIAERARELAAAATGAGYLVSLEGYVSEAATAGLIGVAESTLRDWRNAGRYALRHRRLGGKRGRVQYELRSLAAFLLAAEDGST